MVFVDNGPLAIYFPEADRQPEIQINVFGAVALVLTSHGGIAKGYLLVRYDMHFPDVKDPGSCIGKVHIPGASIGFYADRLKRWGHIVHHYVVGMMCEYRVDIGPANCGGPILDELPDRFFRFGLCLLCG